MPTTDGQTAKVAGFEFKAAESFALRQLQALVDVTIDRPAHLAELVAAANEANLADGDADLFSLNDAAHLLSALESFRPNAMLRYPWAAGAGLRKATRDVVDRTKHGSSVPRSVDELRRALEQKRELLQVLEHFPSR